MSVSPWNGSRTNHMVVFSGKAGNSRHIAKGIAKSLGLEEAFEVHAEDFADSEVYVRLPLEKLKRDLFGAHVIYVQTTVPMENHHFIEMLLTLDALRQERAGWIDLVIPYLVHARQDKVFHRGEALSIRAILRAIKAMRVDRIFTIDVHFWRKVGRVDFAATQIGPISIDGSELQMYNLTATHALATYAKEKLGIDRPIVVIPDKGHRPVAEPVERFFNASPDDVILFDKVRRRDDVSVSLASGKSVPDLSGRQLILFDDMVGTGTTIAKVSTWLRSKGGKDITLACTHAINHKRKAPGEKEAMSTLERLKRAGVTRIVTTDTIKNKEPITKHIVPVAPIFADALQRALQTPVVKQVTGKP
ncbi:MAG TPA: ribose-phosphate diphosphokinase [Nitrososphaerales archaeon]|nr:ribose-phosphate diphosphokinase [Nitrososphaerales archaeon]